MHVGDGRVVSNFIVQALKGEPITIYGDGSQTRSFCYVDDLIDAIVLMMDTPEDVTGPINLGNETEFTVAQLAGLVIKLTNSKSKLIHKPIPADDPRQRKPDTRLADRVLGWKATTPLEVGLQWTINYFDALLGDIPPSRQHASTT
jgi:UDP-glucuronate decarboxylase